MIEEQGDTVFVSESLDPATTATLEKEVFPASMPPPPQIWDCFGYFFFLVLLVRSFRQKMLYCAATQTAFPRVQSSVRSCPGVPPSMAQTCPMVEPRPECHSPRPDDRPVELRPFPGTEGLPSKSATPRIVKRPSSSGPQNQADHVEVRK